MVDGARVNAIPFSIHLAETDSFFKGNEKQSFTAQIADNRTDMVLKRFQPNYWTIHSCSTKLFNQCDD